MRIRPAEKRTRKMTKGGSQLVGLLRDVLLVETSMQCRRIYFSPKIIVHFYYV